MTQWEHEQRQRLADDIWAYDNRIYQQERAAQNGSYQAEGSSLVKKIFGVGLVIATIFVGIATK